MVQGRQNLVWALSLALVAACSDDAGKCGTLCGHEDASAEVGGIVEGLVQSTSGEGVPNAVVMVGSQKTTTDKNGVFRVESVDEGTVQVAVDDKGLSKAQTEAKVDTKEKTTVALTADTTAMVSMDHAEKGGVAVDKGNVRVEISANSLKKSDGSNATGTVEVYYTAVSQPKQAAAAPGGMKGIDSSRPVQLQASGMIDVRFYQGNERLLFDGVADLRFPLGPGAHRDGDELSIWSFDEARGRWLRETKGKVERLSATEPAVVHTKARHFTWWAAAEPLEEATCVSGRLRDAAGAPVSSAQVALRGHDTLLYIQELSGADGTFCLAAPQDAAVEIWALGASGQELVTWSWETTLASEAAECGGDCTELPERAPSPLGMGTSGLEDGGMPGDAGAEPEPDASVEPEPDASVEPELDASVEPELDAGVEPELDASVEPEPDASLEPEPDASTEADAGLERDAGTDAGAELDAGVESDGGLTPVEPEICDNHVDDNADALIDCEDPACASAVRCTGVWLDGMSGYMSIGQIVETPQQQGTVELWIQAGSLGAMTLVDLGSCGTHRIDLEQDGTITASMGGCSPTAPVTTVTATTTAQIGSWVHVAHSWSTQDHALIVNGLEFDRTSHSISAIDNAGINLIAGRVGNLADRYFHGYIDELRLWSVVRSEVELATHYGERLDAETPGLLGYWRFDEGQGEWGANEVDPTRNALLTGGYNWFPLRFEQPGEPRVD